MTLWSRLRGNPVLTPTPAEDAGVIPGLKVGTLPPGSEHYFMRSADVFPETMPYNPGEIGPGAFENNNSGVPVDPINSDVNPPHPRMSTIDDASLMSRGRVSPPGQAGIDLTAFRATFPNMQIVKLPDYVVQLFFAAIDTYLPVDLPDGTLAVMFASDTSILLGRGKDALPIAASKNDANSFLMTPYHMSRFLFWVGDGGFKSLTVGSRGNNQLVTVAAYTQS